MVSLAVSVPQSNAQTWDDTHGKARESLARGDLTEAARLYRLLVEDAEKTSDERLITALLGLGLVSQRSAQYEEAEKNYRRALALADTRYGMDHPSSIDIVLRLGVVLKNRGALPEAEAAFQRALPQVEHSFGVDHPMAGALHEELADVLVYQARQEEAKEHYLAAIKVRERTNGPEDSRLPRLFYRLGLAYYVTGQAGLAIPALERAGRILQRLHGRDHLDVAIVLDSVRNAYLEAGRTADAARVELQALGIRERLLGPEHPQVAENMARHGDLLHFVLGQDAEAATYYERALRIKEKHLGPLHPEVGDILYSLALVRGAQRDFVRTASLLKRVVAIRESALGPEDPATLEAVWKLALNESMRGEYQEAESLHLRVLAGKEKTLGPNHLELAKVLDRIAGLYTLRDQPKGAVVYYRRALEIRERVLGPDHREIVETLESLASAYWTSDDCASAVPLYSRAIGLRDQSDGGSEELLGDVTAVASCQFSLGNYVGAAQAHERVGRLLERREDQKPQFVDALNNLGNTYVAAGDFRKAEIALRRALSVAEQALGPEHPSTAASNSLLAVALLTEGRSKDAEPFLDSAMRAISREGGPEDKSMIKALIILSGVLIQKGRIAEAEVATHRLISVQTSITRADSVGMSMAMTLLALAYMRQGRFDDGMRLAQRGLEIFDVHKLAENRGSVPLLMILGLGQLATQRLADAEKSLRKGVAILSKYQSEEVVSPQAEGVFQILALVLYLQGRVDEAERISAELWNIEVKTSRTGSPVAALSLQLMGDIRKGKGKLVEAEALYRQSLGVQVTAGVGELDLALGLAKLAAVLRAQGRLKEAVVAAERARQLQLNVARAGAEVGDDAYRALTAIGAPGLRDYVHLLSDVKRVESNVKARDEWARRTFAVSEQARSRSVDLAISRGALMALSQDASVGGLVRDVLELRAARYALESEVIEGYTKSLPSAKARISAQSNFTITEIDQKLPGVLAKIRNIVPRFDALMNPDPLEPLEVGRMLRSNEALLSYLVLADRLLIWFVAPGRDLEYRDVPVSSIRLRTLVDRFRQSIDQRQNPLLQVGKLTAVDLESGSELYSLLVAPFEALLKTADHLIVIPDDVLFSLPFAALVTDTAGDDFKALVEGYRNRRALGSDDLASYARISWLVRRYAITVLPSGSSLRALRGDPHRRKVSREEFIGFGDPLLDRTAEVSGMSMINPRSGTVPVKELRKLGNLPGTASELTSIARAMGVDPARALFLAAHATKTNVQKLSATGRLGSARVLAFATHALIAGELTGLRQPALVLTPPTEPHAEDDGLLSLDDIMALKLDGTEWVVLSACNTAAPDQTGEGLSGLTRGFLFAGASALLVSHWSVDDRATALLVSETFRRFGSGATMSRSGSLRDAMLSMVQRSRSESNYLAHPFAWAGFFLVGEGNSPAAGEGN